MAKDFQEQLEARVMCFGDIEYLLKILSSVFKRIDPADADILFDKRNVYFVFPSVNCTVHQTIINPMINSDARYSPLIPLWVINFSVDFENKPKHEQIYTIAHELAHIFFEHGRGCGEDERKIARKIEIEADGKVIEWGFVEELKKTPYNYLYGDGLKN